MEVRQWCESIWTELCIGIGFVENLYCPKITEALLQQKFNADTIATCVIAYYVWTCPSAAEADSSSILVPKNLSQLKLLSLECFSIASKVSLMELRNCMSFYISLLKDSGVKNTYLKAKCMSLVETFDVISRELLAEDSSLLSESSISLGFCMSGFLEALMYDVSSCRVTISIAILSVLTSLESESAHLSFKTICKSKQGILHFLDDRVKAKEAKIKEVFDSFAKSILPAFKTSSTESLWSDFGGIFKVTLSKMLVHFHGLNKKDESVVKELNISLLPQELKQRNSFTVRTIRALISNGGIDFFPDLCPYPERIRLFDDIYPSDSSDLLVQRLLDRGVSPYDLVSGLYASASSSQETVSTYVKQEDSDNEDVLEDFDDDSEIEELVASDEKLKELKESGKVKPRARMIPRTWKKEPYKKRKKTEKSKK